MAVARVQYKLKRPDMPQKCNIFVKFCVKYVFIVFLLANPLIQMHIAQNSEDIEELQY